MRTPRFLVSFLDLLILLSVALTVVLSACSPQQAAVQPSATPAGARLRITNAGTEPIKKLTVLFPDQRISFGDVAAGVTTDYQLAPGGVYNYGAYEFEENGQMVTQPVIDWMGETGKTSGSYTYVLKYTPNVENMLKIELIEVTSE